MKWDILDRIDSVVSGYVNDYTSDWTDIERPMIEQCPDNVPFLVMMRPGGVDVLILAGEKCTMGHVFCGQNACPHNELFLYYDGESMKSVTHRDAEKICAKAASRFQGLDLPVDGLREAVDACYEMAAKYPDDKSCCGYNGPWTVSLPDRQLSVGLAIDIRYESNLVANGYKNVNSQGALHIEFGRYHDIISDKTFKKIFDAVRSHCPVLRLNFDERKRKEEAKNKAGR